MKAKHLLLILFLCTSLPLMAQDTPGWNFVNPTAREKNALYTDLMGTENYEEARKPLHWLLVNNPDLNESIYINAAKIYETLAENTQNEQQAEIYADSAVLLYDLRIQYFNQKEDVLNRKAFSAYKLWKDRKEKYQELFQIMQEAYEANGENFWPQNVLAYMDVARRYKLTGGELTDLDIVNLYDLLDTNLANQEKSDDASNKIGIMREQLDKLLVGSISSECEDIEENLGNLLRERPDNLKLAKVIIKLSFASKCTDSPSFAQAAELVQEKEPSVGLARWLASKALAEGDYDRAIQAYENAIELSEDQQKKAELLLGIAEIHSHQGEKVSARDYARQALELDPNLNEAYRLMGNLYFSSYEQCKGNVSQVDDRAVFIAAYEMYERAGDQEMMARAQQQFPSISMAFDEDRSAGEPVKIGCWINRTVSLRTAPKN